jgi:hypothetical protein
MDNPCYMASYREQSWQQLRTGAWWKEARLPFVSNGSGPHRRRKWRKASDDPKPSLGVHYTAPVQYPSPCGGRSRSQDDPGPAQFVGMYPGRPAVLLWQLASAQIAMANPIAW